MLLVAVIPHDGDDDVVDEHGQSKDSSGGREVEAELRDVGGWGGVLEGKKS